MRIISLLLAAVVSFSQPIMPEWFSISLTENWGIVQVSDSFGNSYLKDNNFDYEEIQIHTEKYSTEYSIQYMTIFIFEDVVVWSFNCKPGQHEEGWVIKVYVDGELACTEKLIHHMCIALPRGEHYAFEAKVTYPRSYIKLEIPNVLSIKSKIN